MFEPFHSKNVDLVSEWNYRQYLQCDERNGKFLEPATSILSGDIKNEWIDQFNHILFPRKRLIKDIRSQLMLKWIKSNFTEIPIILLLRHPCAVANSKLKLSWDTHLDDFLSQKELMSDFLNPFKKELEDAHDPFDKHIFTWCIENYVPLKQFNEGETLVVFYENLCGRPQDEIESIMLFMGERFSLKILSLINKPSALSQKDSAVNAGGDLINAWRENISERQAERAYEILSLFGLQNIYGKGSLPLVTGREALNIFSS